MVNIDFSVVFQIANFLILIWVLNIVLYKPIRGILAQRKEKIAGLEKSIDTLSGDAMEKDDAFAAGVRKARVNGLKEKETLLQAAADEEKEIVGNITEKAQADLAEVRAKIAEDAEKVKSALLEQVDDYAKFIGEKILGRAI